MKDRAALLPNKRKITFDGEPAKYATVEYADQASEPGTILNKANLLSDAVVSELGLTQEDPVPSDALIHLQRSAIQYSTMPTASIDYLNRVVFFIGTTGTYVNGGLYQCVSSGGGSPTYSWVRVYLGAEKEHLEFLDQAVATTGWATYTPSGTEETAIAALLFTYRKTITLPGVTASMNWGSIDPRAAYESCGTTIYRRAQTLTDGVYIYAKAVPTAAFTADFCIAKAVG